MCTAIDNVNIIISCFRCFVSSSCMRCSAGFNNTQLPQAITEINFKHRRMCFVVSFRVKEYIASGRGKFIVDTDPNQIYTKCKARKCSISLPGSSSQNDAAPRVKYPTTAWGKALEKLTLFTKAETKKHVENSVKELEMLNTILFQQALNVQRHFSKMNI